MIYCNFLTTLDFAISPVCYDVLADMDQQYAHILLQDIKESFKPMSREFEQKHLEQLLVPLAKFHSSFWEHEILAKPELGVPHTNSLRFPQALPVGYVHGNSASILQSILPEVRRVLGDYLPPKWGDLFQLIGEQWPSVFSSRIESAKDLTLIHGDLNWQNIFLACADDRVMLIDWECCKVGLSAFDLAYLLISSRSTRNRRRLEANAISFYRKQLCKHGVNFEEESFNYDYRLAIVMVLLVSITWLRVSAINDAMTAFEDWDCGRLFV